MSVLSNIQTKLKAPKSQRNNFGNYNYRSLEDIFEGLKPLLEEYKCSVTTNDEIVLIGERFYVKATASLLDESGKVIASNSAYAREPLMRKGMDDAQVTGATSSYARKYALNGLFAIDDTKDADTDEHKKQTQKAEEKPLCLPEEIANWKKHIWQELENATDLAAVDALLKDKKNIEMVGVLDKQSYAKLNEKIVEIKEKLKGN